MAERLDTALRQLAGDVQFPPTPALLAAVERRLAGSAAPARRRGSWGRALAFAAALTLLVAATVAALALVLPGVRIVPVASLPPEAHADLGARLELGESVPAGTAVPLSVGGLGPPDAAHLAGGGSVVSILYAARADLPAIGGSDIGLLVQRIEGDLDRTMIEKLVHEVGASVTPVTVDGADGFWIEGPSHLVRYLARDGSVQAEMTRLAGDSLVWQRGPALYRMESALGVDATRRLAETVHENR